MCLHASFKGSNVRPFTHFIKITKALWKIMSPPLLYWLELRLKLKLYHFSEICCNYPLRFTHYGLDQSVEGA
jgi:hypothetical protein